MQFVIMVSNMNICTLIPSQLHSPHLAGCGGCWAGGIEGRRTEIRERGQIEREKHDIRDVFPVLNIF